MKNAISFLIFLISFCGNSQNISGSWSWQAENGEAQMEFSLAAEGSDYTGHHCAVFQNGGRIDCVDEDDPASIRIKRTAENVFEGTIKSGYSVSEGKIKLLFNPEAKTLLFEILKAPGEIYYLPKKAVFESFLDQEKEPKNPYLNPEGTGSLNQEKHNCLTLQAYQEIKVNGVSLGELQTFKGEVAAMEELLGMSLSVKIPDPEVRTFYNNSIQLAYGDATADWILGYIEILNSTIPLEILGKNVKIGDDILILGLGTNLKSLPLEGGQRSAVFVTPYDTSFVAIHFDSRTKIIVKIEYVSPT